MKQHGFSLAEFVLTIIIMSGAVLVTAPPFIKMINQANERVQINASISDIYTGMTLALTQHWQLTHCRSAPTLNITDLINNYHVPPYVTQLYNPTIGFISTNTASARVTAITIKLTVPNVADVFPVANLVDTDDLRLKIDGSRITLTRSVISIDSMNQHVNYNPETGCI